MSRRSAARWRPGAGGRATGFEKLDVVGDDLGHTSFLPILAFPRTCLDAAFDENERALARVLRDRLGQVPFADRVRDAAVVVGELLPLAVWPCRPAVRGKGAVRHCSPAV